MIERHLTATSSNNYINKLQYLIDEYNNNNIHSTIEMTPLQATDSNNASLVLFNSQKKNKYNIEKPKFIVGDRVRIYSYESKFDEGYKSNWTREIFVIRDIRQTNTITYKLKDLNGEDIIKSFYAQELQLTRTT